MSISTAAKSARHGSPRKSKARAGASGASDGRRDPPPTPTASSVALSRALGEARSKVKLSKVEAAKRVGVHFVTLYAWENERRGDQPSDQNLARAARVYRTSAARIKRRAAEIKRALEESAGGDASDAARDSHASASARTVARHQRPRRSTRPPGNVGTDARATPPSVGGAASPVARARGRTPAHGKQLVALEELEDSAVRGPLPYGAYVRALRVLADIAEQIPLTAERLAAAQRALTAPELLQLFAAVSQRPLTEDDILAAVDSAGVAVRSYVASRRALKPA